MQKDPRHLPVESQERRSTEPFRPSQLQPWPCFWKLSTCSFRTILSIIPVFLNFLTTTHGKKNTFYCNLDSHTKHQEMALFWISFFSSSRFTLHFSPAGAHGSYLETLLPAPTPAKAGFGQWKRAQAGNASGRRGVELGIFHTGFYLRACYGMSACLFQRSWLLSGHSVLPVFWKFSFLYLFKPKNDNLSLLLRGPDIAPCLAASAFASSFC